MRNLTSQFNLGPAKIPAKIISKWKKYNPNRELPEAPADNQDENVRVSIDGDEDEQEPSTHPPRERRSLGSFPSASRGVPSPEVQEVS